jgi:hypothetical protein
MVLLNPFSLTWGALAKPGLMQVQYVAQKSPELIAFQ